MRLETGAGHCGSVWDGMRLIAGCISAHCQGVLTTHTCLFSAIIIGRDVGKIRNQF
jgi:hypothetical protein